MKSEIHQYSRNNFKIVCKKLITAIVLLVSISSFAQDKNQSDKKSDRPRKERQTPEERSQNQLAKLTVELSLNAQQQEQIKPILDEQNAKFEAMRANRSNNSKRMTAEEREALKKERQENKKTTDAKLQAILTPEQFKKWTEAEEAKKAKMREAIENFENDRNNGGDRNNGINIENREEN